MLFCILKFTGNNENENEKKNSYDPTTLPRLVDFDDELWKSGGGNKFGLSPGEWTDDASMSLCLAGSRFVFSVVC